MPNKIHDEIRADIHRRLNDMAKAFTAQSNPAAAAKLTALSSSRTDIPDGFIQKWQSPYETNLARWLAVVSTTVVAAGSASLDYAGFLTSLDTTLTATA